MYQIQATDTHEITQGSLLNLQLMQCHTTPIKEVEQTPPFVERIDSGTHNQEDLLSEILSSLQSERDHTENGPNLYYTDESSNNALFIRDVASYQQHDEQIIMSTYPYDEVTKRRKLQSEEILGQESSDCTQEFSNDTYQEFKFLRSRSWSSACSDPVPVFAGDNEDSLPPLKTTHEIIRDRLAIPSQKEPFSIQGIPSEMNSSLKWQQPSKHHCNNVSQYSSMGPFNQCKQHVSTMFNGFHLDRPSEGTVVIKGIVEQRDDWKPLPVRCNNKRALDDKWPRHILQGTLAELTQWAQANNLTGEEQQQLKSARRRYQNRNYPRRRPPTNEELQKLQMQIQLAKKEEAKLDHQIDRMQLLINSLIAVS